MWEQFIGKKKDVELLKEKANRLAIVIVAANLEAIKDLMNDLKVSINEDTISFLGLEFMIFIMHCINRIASEHLNPKEIAMFMEILLSRSIEILNENCNGISEKEEFKNYFVNTLKHRREAYAKYKLRSDGDSLKDTLFWEFAKLILAGLKLGQYDILKLMIVASHSAAHVKALQISELLGK